MFHKVVKLNLHKILFLQNINQTCSYCMMSNSKKESIEESLLFFQKIIGLADKDVNIIYNKYPSFKNDSYSELLESYTRLMDFGFSKGDIIKRIQVLTLHPITIKNYLYLLEEGGFNKNKIDSKILLRYKYISKKSIESLKKEKYIPENIDVQHNILSFLKYPKELYPKNCDESLSWDQIQRNVFQLLVRWKIQMDIESVIYAQTVYHRLCNKSFRLMEKTLNILLKELKFSKERIRRHSYLIHSDPDNTMDILSNLDSICGMDVEKTLKKHPKIILTPWTTIKKIQKHFEEFGIPESALMKAPEIYTLGSNTVYERLRKIKETPELASFINNPQVARLVYYQKKVDSRLKFLQNKNCISLNLLVTSDSLFNRFNCNGNEKGKSNDTMIYLTSVLGGDKVKLRAILERHPFWHYTSLLRIRTTFEFLTKKKFTSEQINHCLQILLYPVDKIEDALEATHDMKNVSYLKNSSGSIKPEYILPLVLYNLEKDHHFSGDGVWETNSLNKPTTETNSSKTTFEDTEELDHEPESKLFL